MNELEQLTEALTHYENAVYKSEVVWDQKSLVAAARAYRDLLANGERVWDCIGGSNPCGPHSFLWRDGTHNKCGWHIVSKLLVDPPTTKEER